MTPTHEGAPELSFSQFAPMPEVEAIQSPALGAFLLWRMGASYQAAGPTSPRLDLHFLVLPLVLHGGTREVITSTNSASGLSKFVYKMLDTESELIALNARVHALKDLTLASVSLGVSTGLLWLDHETGLVCSLDTNKKPIVLEGIKNLERGAERLGHWFGQLPRTQVFSMLRVHC
jgi:hypothetical protein